MSLECLMRISLTGCRGVVLGFLNPESSNDSGPGANFDKIFNEACPFEEFVRVKRDFSGAPTGFNGEEEGEEEAARTSGFFFSFPFFFAFRGITEGGGAGRGMLR